MLAPRNCRVTKTSITSLKDSVTYDKEVYHIPTSSLIDFHQRPASVASATENPVSTGE